MPFTSKTAAEAGKRSTRKNVPNKNTEESGEAYQLLVEKNLKKMSTWLNKVGKEDPAPEKAVSREERDAFIKKMEGKIQEETRLKKA